MSDRERITQPAQNLAFELLSLAGELESFDALQGELKIDNEQCARLRVRAEFYHLVQRMSECELEAFDFASFFEHGTLADYTRSSSNPSEAQALLRVLNGVINMSMEAYAQLDAVGILAKESITACIKNNLKDPSVKKDFTSFIESAYATIFCTSYVEKQHLDELFPVIDEWRSLVEPEKIVTSAIMNVDDLSEFVGRDGDSGGSDVSEFFIAALGRQMEMTSREFVSDLYFTHHSDSEAYAFLVERNLIDKPPVEANVDLGEMTARTRLAIRNYEKKWFIYEGDVKELLKNIGADGADHLAVAVERWLREGRVARISPLFEAKSAPPCNVELARKLVTQTLIKKMENDDVAFLASALALPLQLVDASVPELSGFRLAQNVKQLGKKGIGADERDAGVKPSVKRKSANKTDTESSPETTKGGRKFVKIPMDEFKEIVNAALNADDDTTPRNLTPKVSKDLDKVNFDLENIDWDGSFRKELLGFHELENGLTFLGTQAGGDSESPVYFIIYWDGKALRGYIPTDGNPWNTDTKTAYGNDEEADLINAKKRYPDTFADEDFVEVGVFEFDAKAIFADIQKRITEK
jgi:hypothetical protein